MSAGPIKRERESTRAATIPKPPSRGDVVRLAPAPYGFELWVVAEDVSRAAAPADVVLLTPQDPECPIHHVRRRINQLERPTS